MPANWRPVYIIQFTLLSIIGIGYTVWYEITQVTDDTPAQTIRAIIQSIGHVGLAAAIISTVSTETARSIMVIGEWLQETIRNRQKRAIARAVSEAEARAGAEAHAEANARWAAWNELRLQAEAKGQPFNEPPPDQSD